MGIAGDMSNILQGGTPQAPRPLIASIDPTEGVLNQPVTITITGARFTPSATLLDNGAALPGVVFVNDTTLTVTFTPTMWSYRNLRVVDEGGVSNFAEFYVQDPDAPTLTSLTPSSISAATVGPSTIVVTGTKFNPETVMVTAFGADLVAIGTTTFVSETELSWAYDPTEPDWLYVCAHDWIGQESGLISLNVT